jgi:release factor glutamine methyltransferase
MTDIRSALKEGIARLREARVPSHTLAAELLLMHATQRDRVWLYSHPDDLLDTISYGDFLSLIAKRASGVPTQYLTGKQEFWGLEFHVEPGVLIPRPETEHIIEVALERVGKRALRRIADVGTGSGCLAVALAKEFPDAQISATDTSPTALAIAKRNAERHGVAGRIRFMEGSLLGPFLPASSHARAVPFEVIVSNPPYIGRAEESSLPREVREHEPHEALFGGQKGFEVYPTLIEQARALLVQDGLLVLELSHDSLPSVFPLFAEGDQLQGVPAKTAENPAQHWHDVRITHDLAGIPRVISAIRSGKS